jgi:hypothetical protein
MRRAGVAFALVAAFIGLRYLAFFEGPPVVDRSSHAWKAREAALARARVFVDDAPRSPSGHVGPEAAPIAADRPLRCTYVPKRITGTTPKFDCRLSDGTVVKVKYGANPEVPAELAATRLLAALGFGADHMSYVAKVECVGCPPHPYRTRQLAEILFLSRPYEWIFNSARVRTFDHVAVERKFEAEPIEVGEMEGWEWSDLDRVDESQGGATRAELDALRLMAVLLAHWDNKGSNQRLVCLDAQRADRAATPAARDTEPCRRPLVMLQDLGATFGPRKVNHRSWAETPIWESDQSCMATMASLPHNGATFRRVPISDEGRLLLARKLGRLTDRDMDRLFRGAGFPDPTTGASPSDYVTPWVDALRDKIKAITHHGPCPSRS